MCLEEVARVDVGGEVGRDKLFILSPGLGGENPSVFACLVWKSMILD